MPKQRGLEGLVSQLGLEPGSDEAESDIYAFAQQATVFASYCLLPCEDLSAISLPATSEFACGVTSSWTRF